MQCTTPRLVGSDLASSSPGQISDDELAATQQSILEELHSISEETILDRQVSSEPESCIPDTAAAARTTIPSKYQCLVPKHEDAAQDLEPRPIASNNIQLPVPTFVDHDEGFGPAKPWPRESDRTTLIAVPFTNTVMLEPDATRSAASATAVAVASKLIPSEAAEVPVKPAEQPSSADPASVGPELPDPMEGLDEPEFDHSDLFDGIDVDAFDDIELSPPVGRQTFLHPIGGAGSSHQHSHASASQCSTGLKLSSIEDDSYTHEQPEASQMASFLDPAFAGFKTGHGKQVKPSEKALEAARKLLLDLEDLQDPLPPQASQSVSQLRPRISDPSPCDQHPVKIGGTAKSLLARAPMQEIIPRQWSVKGNGDQTHSPLPKTIVASTPAVIPAQAMSTSPLERQPFATPEAVRGGLISSSQKQTTPVRTPGAASGSRFTTPQPSKRSSLGVMPRVEIGGSLGKKRALPKFITPFKGGKRPRAQDQEDPASPLRRMDKYNQELSIPSHLASRHYPPTRKIQASTSASLAGPAVFLMHSNAPRHGLGDVGRPEHHSALQMIAKGVPDEVLVILNDASRATQYAFEAEDGSLLTQQDALDELHSKGCTTATLPWVQNHWALVLWKLAAMVRLAPSSANERWSWTELIRQLLYRYEREVHLAQRSCLKRIQEHDSSPARPMVLFVSKILEEEEEVQDRSGQVVVRRTTLLELSDGWYRIQAQVDPVLAGACQRGRLRIGHKLSIMGATLDTQGEGNEVLVAYHMSSLVLASNSVSLARWDAKLGFASTPFFASLRSLTPEGGLVSLMDVVITKVFPLAYVDVDRSTNGKPGAPRGEQEEAEERDFWSKRREDALHRLELQFESETRGLYELVEALSDLVGDAFLPSIPEDPTGRQEALASSVFDQLRAQPDPASAVGELVVGAGHARLAPWLHSMAKSALLAEDDLGGSRLGPDLDRLCPPRKVREFRVVRFRDARLTPSETPMQSSTNTNAGGAATAKKRNPHARTVQLTVWDPTQLGDELQEGRRFLVTNLIPSSKTAWRKPDDAADVFLSTRRDTKWRLVSA